jgi:NhaA family Na+:H+ antiporter
MAESTAKISPAALGGIVLVAVSGIALAWANSPWSASYEALWGWKLHVGIGAAAIDKPLLLWVNDGLMAIFFLLVGLELKREMASGELSDLRQAALPIVAAAGGVAVPALVYVGFNLGGPGAPGWAIPAATDIAFALGILALLGSRAPFLLKLFLTTVAVVDDLIAVLIIAIFYTDQIALLALGIAAAAFGALVLLNRADVRHPLLWIPISLILWVAVLKSGVHATVAGVLIAMAWPPPVERLEHILHPWVMFGVVPIFALANAGVSLSGIGASIFVDPVAVGVALGLMLGKPIGITLAAWAAVRLGFAALPTGVTWMKLHGAAWLGGIGFTMSLFIAGLAFDPGPMHDAAKVGLLFGSLVAGIVGATILLMQPRDAVEDVRAADSA